MVSKVTHTPGTEAVYEQVLVKAAEPETFTVEMTRDEARLVLALLGKCTSAVSHNNNHPEGIK